MARTLEKTSAHTGAELLTRMSTSAAAGALNRMDPRHVHTHPQTPSPALLFAFSPCLLEFLFVSDLAATASDSSASFEVMWMRLQRETDWGNGYMRRAVARGCWLSALQTSL